MSNVAKLRELLSRFGGSVGVIWLFLGKSVALAGNAALFLVLGRTMDPVSFGLFASVIGAQIVVSRIILFGTDVGTFRLEKLEPAWLPFVRGASLLIILSGAAIASVLAAIAATPMAVRLLPGPPWFGPVVVAGAMGMVLHDHVYWLRLADHGYRSAGTFTGIVGASRSALVCSAALAGGVRQPVPLLLMMAAVPLTASAIALILSRPRLRGLPKAILVRLMQYCGWQATSNVLGALTLQQGTLILSLLHKPKDAGAFGLAITLGTAAVLVLQSVQEFLISRAVHVSADQNRKLFLAKASALTGMVAVVLFGALLAAFWLLNVFLSERLPLSAAVFVPIALSLTVLLLHAPFEAVCHNLMRPDVIVAGKSLRLVIGVVLGFQWGAASGAAGVSMALLVGTIVSFAASAIYTIWALSSRYSGKRSIIEEIAV